MKTAIVCLFLTLCSMGIAQAESVGEIVDFKGSIESISASTVTIDGAPYHVDTSTMITVNGARGTVANLTRGMKIEGSAEITVASTPRHPQSERTLRMVYATTDPNYHPPENNGAANQPGVPRQFPPGYPMYPNMPGGMRGAGSNLVGTFWALEKLNRGNQARTQTKSDSTPWFGLNADGSVYFSWKESVGHWFAQQQGNQLIRVSLDMGDNIHYAMYLEPDLSKGRLSSEMPQQPGAPPQGDVALVSQITSPTQDMRDKAASVAKAMPTPPPPAAPTPPPASPEVQTAASDIVKTQHNNLVFVTGTEGAGSGFIANMDGATYLVTNAHVAAGINNADFKTLDDTAVKGGAPGVAVGEDIFRMALPSGSSKPLEVMQGVDSNASIGDDVVVLGNAEGSGVINTIMGKIVGIGPKLVEVDAQFVPGNSGSPIIHIKSGKVIGVATYLVTKKYDATTGEKLAAPVIHRYGYRIDSVKTWQPVDWRTFYAQADAMRKIHALTDDLYDFFKDIHDNKGSVTIERHTNPAIKDRISQWLDSKRGNHSAFDRQNADANFLSFLKVACQTDVANTQRYLTYDYFQRDLADEQETRNEMSKAFLEIIQDIQGN